MEAFHDAADGALWPCLPVHGRLSVRRWHAWAVVKDCVLGSRRCFVTVAAQRARVARHVLGCHAPPPALPPSREGDGSADATCSPRAAGSPASEELLRWFEPLHSGRASDGWRRGCWGRASGGVPA